MELDTPLQQVPKYGLKLSENFCLCLSVGLFVLDWSPLLIDHHQWHQLVYLSAAVVFKLHDLIYIIILTIIPKIHIYKYTLHNYKTRNYPLNINY